MGQVLVKDFYDVGARSFDLNLPPGTSFDDARAHLAAVSGIEVHRQRLYHQGKRLTGLEAVDLASCKEVVLLRLPIAEPPSDDEVFERGDMRSGAINTAYLWHLFEHEGRLSVLQANAILKRAEAQLRTLPNLVEVKEPVAIVTDVHGQWYDLAPLFNAAGGLEAIDANRPGFATNATAGATAGAAVDATAGATAGDQKQNFLFLGDYVDRGRWSSECALFLMALFVNEPHRFTLLRGNHECRSQMQRQNTHQEFLDKYTCETFELLIKAFMALPLAAVVRCGPHKLFCVHGGIGPYIQYLHEINAVNRFVEEPTDDRVVRDLTWSDPTLDTMLAYKPDQRVWDLTNLDKATWPWCRGGAAAQMLIPRGPLMKSMFQPNPQRGSMIGAYTLQALHVFLLQNDLLCIIRGHEQKDGFEFGKAGPKYFFPAIISAFSAPNYTDRSKNLGAVVVCKDGILSINEYEWRIHPCYDRYSKKDLPREDFHVMIAHLRPSALMDLTEEQLDATFHSVAPVRRVRLNRRDLWALLRRNLERVPSLATASPQDLVQRAETLAAWFAKVDHLRRGRAREAEHERESVVCSPLPAPSSPMSSRSTSSDGGPGAESVGGSVGRSVGGSVEDDRPYEAPPGEAEPWRDWPFPEADVGQGVNPHCDGDVRMGGVGAGVDGSVELPQSRVPLLLGGLGGLGSRSFRARGAAAADAAAAAAVAAADGGELELSAVEEMELLRDAFDLFDEDGSGAITACELHLVLQQMGKDVTPEEAEVILAQFDRNHDKQLSFPEFEDLVRDHFGGEERLERAIKAAWTVFDSNRDGSLSASELKTIMTRLGYPMEDEDVEEMMDVGDEDGNMLLSFEEFRAQILNTS